MKITAVLKIWVIYIYKCKMIAKKLARYTTLLLYFLKHYVRVARLENR